MLPITLRSFSEFFFSFVNQNLLYLFLFNKHIQETLFLYKNNAVYTQKYLLLITYRNPV